MEIQEDSASSPENCEFEYIQFLQNNEDPQTSEEIHLFCRSGRMLKNKYFPAKIGNDTTKNGSRNVFGITTARES